MESMMVNQWNQWWKISGINDGKTMEPMMANQWSQWWWISGISDNESLELMMANQWNEWSRINGINDTKIQTKQRYQINRIKDGKSMEWIMKPVESMKAN